MIDTDGVAESVDGANACDFTTDHEFGGNVTGHGEVDAAAAIHKWSEHGSYDGATVVETDGCGDITPPPLLPWSPSSSSWSDRSWWRKGLRAIRYGRWWGKHVAMVVMAMQAMRCCMNMAGNSAQAYDCELRQGGAMTRQGDHSNQQRSPSTPRPETRLLAACGGRQCGVPKTRTGCGVGRGIGRGRGGGRE